MKQTKFKVAMVGLLQFAFAGLVQAGSPYDNFPLTDSAAETVKKPPAMPAGPSGKVCYLFNPPSFDRQWAVSCDPSAPKPEPTKMCRIMTTSGWDAVLFTEPCANQEARAAKSSTKP